MEYEGFEEGGLRVCNNLIAEILSIAERGFGWEEESLKVHFKAVPGVILLGSKRKFSPVLDPALPNLQIPVFSSRAGKSHLPCPHLADC
jgi:hypothetical protein